MCSEPIADEHQHVVNVEGRQLMCVCRGCYLLFTDDHAQLRYRAIPDRYLSFPDFALGRREWEMLQIPVGLAFFFRNSELGRTVAFYPGPAGATESQLDLDAWNGIRAADPRVDMLADDTEALIVRVPDDETQPPECHLVPIDACYEFVGRLRMLWRGFDGGQEVHNYIDEFFGHVTDRSKVIAHDRGHLRRPRRGARTLRGDTGAHRARRVAAVGDDPVHAIALRCQVRIEPLRRGYSDDEAAGLLDLFGPRERWSTTQRTFLWQHSTAMVPGFSGATQVDLPLECTYDFEVAAAKYLHALRDGTIRSAVPLQRNCFHPRRPGLRRAAGAVGPRGPLRHAGRGLAGADRAALPEHRVDSASARHPRRVGRLQVTARAARIRRCDFIAAFPAPPRRSDERGLGSGPRRRRRGVVRGLSALPVSGQFA